MWRAVLILVGLGGNLSSRYGGSDKTLLAAIDKLGELGVRVLARSRLWRSAPVPASDQPWYCNAVVSVQTALAPEALMVLLRAVEDDFGRVRSDARNEARVLDLDLLAYHGEVVREEHLHIPHPRMAGRGFVLYPLMDIAAEWVHPVSGRTVRELAAELADADECYVLEAVAA
jgi:2-amino-4-hydroxy-6-hydroxymethyldihydropteridine diphosphokinase